MKYAISYNNYNYQNEINGIEIKQTNIGKCGEECIYTFNSTNGLLTIVGNNEVTEIDSTLKNKIKEGGLSEMSIFFLTWKQKRKTRFGQLLTKRTAAKKTQR